jgi:hypothetical protein
MPLMVLTAEQLQKLNGYDGPVEVCSPDGLRVGFLTPAPAKRYNLDPGVSDEELDRREAAGGGRKLTDILRDLEGRA